MRLEHFEKFFSATELAEVQRLHAENDRIFKEGGDLNCAIGNMQNIVEIVDKPGCEIIKANHLRNLGNVYLRIGKTDESLSSFESALKIQAEMDDTAGRSLTIRDMSHLFLLTGEYPKAISFLDEAIAIFAKLELFAEKAVTLHHKAALYLRLNKITKALELYMDVVDIATNYKIEKLKCSCLYEIGRIHIACNDTEKAKQYLFESIRICKKFNDKQGLAKTYHYLGLLYFEEKKYINAEKIYALSIKIDDEINDPQGKSSSLHDIGNIHFMQNDFQKAISFYEKSIDIKLVCNDADGLIASYDAIALAYEELENYGESIRYHYMAAGLKDQLGYVYKLVESIEKVVQVYAYKLNDIPAAKSVLEETIPLIEKVEPNAVTNMKATLCGFKEIPLTINRAHKPEKVFGIGDVFIGSYEISDIFEGSMGVVYKLKKINCKPHEEEYICAKTFHTKYLSHLQAKKDFFEEAECWMLLCPYYHIIEAFDYRVIDEKPYIFLEYADAGNLRSRIESDFHPRENIRDFCFALQFSCFLSNGMQRIYSILNRPHGDLRIENILFTKKILLKISDFGLVASANKSLIRSEKDDRQQFGKIIWYIFTGRDDDYRTIVEKIRFEKWIPEKIRDLIKSAIDYVDSNSTDFYLNSVQIFKEHYFHLTASKLLSPEEYEAKANAERKRLLLSALERGLGEIDPEARVVEHSTCEVGAAIKMIDKIYAFIGLQKLNHAYDQIISATGILCHSKEIQESKVLWKSIRYFLSHINDFEERRRLYKGILSKWNSPKLSI